MIILSDAAPDVAHVWTSQPARARRLLRDHPTALVERHVDERGRISGLEFDVPAGCVKIRPKRRLSARQRAVLERARAAARTAKSGLRSLRPQTFAAVERVGT